MFCFISGMGVIGSRDLGYTFKIICLDFNPQGLLTRGDDDYCLFRKRK